MNDPLHPSLATRVRAVLRGECDAKALEALRAAGVGVYQELGEAEQYRTRLLIGDQDAGTRDRAAGGYLAATWNAFVLHSLGAALLDADYTADAGTVGFVPPVTFEQAWSWFSAAQGWLSHARQARANPDYDLAVAVGLPAGLPAWAQAEPCPPAHLQAMLTAIPPIRQHAELALFDLDKTRYAASELGAVNTLRQLAAEADAAADYARALRGERAGQQLHELIETHLKHALTLWFHVGQLAAVPTLIGGYRAAAAPASVDPLTMPGGPRFDPWCLTDPATVDQWRNDPKARRAIASLWAVDPDPARTLIIHAQIQAALAAGAVTRMAGMPEGSYFYCCPWSPIYQVRREVTINGQPLSPPHQFTFDVSAEELAENGTFVRRILLGPFTPTAEVDYCDPASGGHHDD